MPQKTQKLPNLLLTCLDKWFDVNVGSFLGEGPLERREVPHKWWPVSCVAVPPPFMKHSWKKSMFVIKSGQQ